MHGKNRRGLKKNKDISPNYSSLPELNFIASRAMNAANYLLSFCAGPSSSDDEHSPKNRDSLAESRFRPSEPAIAAAASSTSTRQNSTLKLTEAAVRALATEEEMARQSVAKVCEDESLQIEALFCATTQKHDAFQQEAAGRNTLFARQLFFMRLPAASAIQAEEEQARSELETIFGDDTVIAEFTKYEKA